MIEARVARKRRRLRIVLLAVTSAAVVSLAVWGYLSAFTDVLVLRGTPIQRLVSPDGRWELRVYEVVHDDLPGGSVWLAAVVRTSDAEAHQRVVFYGADVTFAWAGRDMLVAREFPSDVAGKVHQIDVVSGSYGVEERWTNDPRGLSFIIAVIAFVPACIALLAGVPVALFLPRLLWRQRERN